MASTQRERERNEYSLQGRVIELILVSPSHRRPHTLVGPQAGKGVAKERKQHLIFIEAPPTRQDRMGVDLREVRDAKWITRTELMTLSKVPLSNTFQLGNTIHCQLAIVSQQEVQSGRKCSDYPDEVDFRIKRKLSAKLPTSCFTLRCLIKTNCRSFFLAASRA